MRRVAFWGRVDSPMHTMGRLSSLFHLPRYDNMKYPGKITDARQHEHQVMYPAEKDECVWSENRDEIY